MNRKERRAALKQGSAEAICAVAIALEREGRMQQAMSRYRQALETDPGLHQAHNNLARLLHNQGRYDDALVHYREAVRLDPDNCLYHNNVGALLGDTGQLEDAAKFHARAIALKPDYIDAHVALGRALVSLGRLDEGIARFSAALDLQPFNLDARINLGLALVTAGRNAEALNHAEIASRFSEEPTFPHFTMGLLLARCGAAEAARMCFTNHLKQDPDDRKGARLLLAGLGGDALPERASAGHMEELYACRAAHYDEGAGSAGYRGAELVAQMFERCTAGSDKLDIADAGCGTGLVGARIADKARRLVGVDMSVPMLEKAKSKGVYTHVQRGDLVAFLNANPASFDAVTCAATLIHFGDLGPAFQATAKSLRENGLFVFTLFPNDDDDAVTIGDLDGYAEGGCFKHGRNYVALLADRAGFAVEAMELGVHEHIRGNPKMGLVVALRRVKAPQQQASAA